MSLILSSAVLTAVVGGYAKATTNGTALNGGWAIKDADATAGRFGYIITELCYIQPDFAADYNDIEAYLPNRTVPSGQY